MLFISSFLNTGVITVLTSADFSKAPFPILDESILVESSFEYPVMMNGKMRTKITFSLDTPKNTMEEEVMKNEIVLKWLEGKTPKKLIVVPNKIINVVM